MPPEGALRASHTFAFERDFVGNWRCIPLCLRRKLDMAGIKLRLRHWLALTVHQRQDLVDWPDDAGALAALAERILTLTDRMDEGAAPRIPPVQGEPWQQDGVLPEHLRDEAAKAGHRLDGGRWGELAELERFALCKLARPGHDHHNLEAALSEILL